MACTAALGVPLSLGDRRWLLQLGTGDLNFPSKLLQSAPLKLKSTLGIHSTVILKVNYAEGNVLGSIVMYAIKSL